MGILNRIFNGTRFNWLEAADRSLVDEPVQKNKKSNKDNISKLELTPWSATRLASIFRDMQQAPTNKLLAESRKSRQCLSKFWLNAPVDQLEGLYRSPVGQCYRMLLKTTLASQPLLLEEQQWRDVLAKKLSENLNRPESINILLALMPYFERGKMRLLNATNLVPQWLINDYSALFDPGLAKLLTRQAGLLGPAGSTGDANRLNSQEAMQGRQAITQQPITQAGVGMPVQRASQTNQLPVMAQRRGNEALALIQNQEFIGRMNGLINLYTIDPSDSEVKRELIGLRRQMGQIWLDINPSQLQALYQSSYGQMYRNFLGSGFSREALTTEDQQLRSELARYVSNMVQQKAVNALLAVLPYFRPGQIQLGGGEQFLPPWLLRDINTLNSQASAIR